LMDFTLSNFSNSGIDKVGILIETQPRSIMKHLGCQLYQSQSLKNWIR
jgi:ADP-glucose pyrophosphorylase